MKRKKTTTRKLFTEKINEYHETEWNESWECYICILLKLSGIDSAVWGRWYIMEKLKEINEKTRTLLKQ